MFAELNMKTMIFRFNSVLLLIAVLVACTSRTPMNLLEESIIPKPVIVTATNSSFVLSEKAGIYYQQSSEALKFSAKFLSEILNKSTGFGIQVSSADQAPAKGNIYLRLSNENTELGEEGYEIMITENLVTISAQNPEGVFRGVQTLRQLLPAKIESSTVREGPWEIATGAIIDQPVYAYRGAMLDVSRHFFQVEDVKRYIDLLAVYKLNTLLAPFR